MAGYSDTRQMIIDTLMGRPAGTEIQPEDHQAFALQITDYVRSVELVAGNATPIGFADALTVPVQPDNGQALYLSQVGRGTTVVFTNFIDQSGNAISVTSDSSSVTLVNLLWNGQYWTKQETRISLENTIQENDIANGAVTTPKIANKAVTSEKLADGAVTVNKIADRSILGNKIASNTITSDKFDPDWRKNLAHKAVVYNFNFNNPDNVPQFVQAYKADANQSVFLVYRSGMYYPAVLITQKNNEAIIFYQPEGTNLKKVIVRATGVEEVTIWGDTVRYGNQTLTDAQKAQARNNIGISEYETFNDITKLSNLTAKKLLYVGESEVSIPMNVANLIEIQSSVLEVDFQDAVIKFTKPTVDWEQQFSLRALLRGHGRCRLKNVTIDTSEQDFGFINDHDANIAGGGISHIQGFGYVDNCFIINGFDYVDNSFGFRSCDHLTNCKVGGDNAPANPYSYCNYLIQCRVDNKFGGGTFANCNFIFQCYVTGPGFDLSECSNIVTLIRVDSSGNIVETWSNDKLIVGGYDMTNMLKTISTVGSTGKTKLYAKPDDKSGIATVLLDTTPVNWAVARRTATGTLKVKDAVEEDDTVTKKQLDAVKAKITPVLQEIDLTGTNANRKAKLDQFEADWKALTGASDLTGARFVGIVSIGDSLISTLFCWNESDGRYTGVTNGALEDESLRVVKINATVGTIDITPLFSHLEAITIKTGNTTSDKTDNMAAIQAYVDNLKALGVDTTKGFSIPVYIDAKGSGFLCQVGDNIIYYMGVMNSYGSSSFGIAVDAAGGYYAYKLQTETDNSLTTTSKKIVSAINEVYALAQGVKAFGAIELKASDDAANKTALAAYLKILTDAQVDTTNGYSVPVRITGNAQEYHGMLNIGTGVLLSGIVTDVNENHHYPFNVSTTDGAITFDESNYFLEKTSNEVTEMLDAIKYSHTSVPFTDTTLSNKAQLEVFLSKVPDATVMHCTYKEIWAGTLHKINGDWYGLLVKNTNSPADNINIKLSADGTVITSNSAQ